MCASVLQRQREKTFQGGCLHCPALPCRMPYVRDTQNVACANSVVQFESRHLLPHRMCKVGKPPRSHVRIFVPENISQSSRSQADIYSVQANRSSTSRCTLITVVVRRRGWPCSLNDSNGSTRADQSSESFASSEYTFEHIHNVPLQLQAYVQDCSSCHVIHYDTSAQCALHDLACQSVSAFPAALKLINQQQTVSSLPEAALLAGGTPEGHKSMGWTGLCKLLHTHAGRHRAGAAVLAVARRLIA